MLCHAFGENFLFNQHIFQSGVVFDKIHILGDVLVQDFGGRARLAIFHAISVALTPTAVGRLLADGVLCHLERVPHRHAVGEEVAACALGYIAQGVVGRAIVKARIVGDNRLDIVLLAQVSDMAARGVDGNNLTLTGGDLGFVQGALLSIIGGVKQRAVGTKNVIDNEAESLVDAAALVMNSAAQVVHHGVVKAVRGLGVDSQLVRFASVDGHGKNLIS